MHYRWNEKKAAENRARHGVDFMVIDGFDWATAKTAEDLRYDYGERRWQSIGKIGERVHVVVYLAKRQRSSDLIAQGQRSGGPEI